MLSFFKPKPPIEFPGPILPPQVGNDFLLKHLIDDAPFMAARYGSVELDCVRNYLRTKTSFLKGFKRGIKQQMVFNAGFFPGTNDLLVRYSEQMIHDTQLVDLMCIWEKPEEPEFYTQYCPTAAFTPLRTLNSFLYETPWTSALYGKKVLIISPFTKSILSQYQHHRASLFLDPLVMPLFEISTIKAVQSIAGTKTAFTDWFEALESMQYQMNEIDFDIALISAGAYGFCLAAHAKRLGKKAIHVGGGGQLLFGIKGKRFDDDPNMTRFYNEAWVRPLDEEKPPSFNKIEDGCYW